MPRRPIRTLATLALLGLACSRPPTRGELDTTQMAEDMSAAVNDLRDVNSELRASLDSLTKVVARQDTLLRQIANVTGVPVPVR